MTLKQLLNIHGQLDWRDQSRDFECSGLCFDSRKMSDGQIYVAIRGYSSDGHDFIDKVAGQAAALVVEDLTKVPETYRGAVLVVLDTRLSLQVLSQRLFESPGEQMMAIAVTGTNGKTSSAYIIEALINSSGGLCGVIGTIDHHLKEKIWKSELTTPDPVTLQGRLKEFLDEGADSFVIEASSHALFQNRINQGFDVCLFTNLSRDHLDYHKDMEDYFQAKALLFGANMVKQNKDCFAVINGDDPYGQKLKELSQTRENFLFGRQNQNDFVFSIVDESLEGCRFQLVTANKENFEFHSPLIGEHNVYNMVGALVALHLVGHDLNSLKPAVQNFKGVPGRLQSRKSAQGVYGFVDYAHTPDALVKAVDSLKAVKNEKGRVVTVFGCGGDRDKGKRPLMFEAAQKGSDIVVVTSDNPRSESPEAIINDILENRTVDSSKVFVEADRAKAIQKAVSVAQPGDVVLVAGKGHEDYQILGDKRVHFSDLEELSKAMGLKL